MQDSEVIFELKAALMRRMIALGALVTAGGALIYVAFDGATGGFLVRVLLVCGGAGILVFTEWFRQSTGVNLQLTKDGLRDTNGQWICKLDDVEKVNRGIIAMKPSGGFLLAMKKKAKLQWSPGMWWRVGSTIGVGGVTDRYMSRAVAEYMALALKERDEAKDAEDT